MPDFHFVSAACACPMVGPLHLVDNLIHTLYGSKILHTEHLDIVTTRDMDKQASGNLRHLNDAGCFSSALCDKGTTEC